jgi:tRNA-splicing ligase RtcB (3'-phosphate/5'-hydroxy nucleic acid ligase)
LEKIRKTNKTKSINFNKTNHYVEVGVDGDDTIISVHSGSRNYGGELYKKHLAIAKQHTREIIRDERLEILSSIEPKLREDFLKGYKAPYRAPVLNLDLYPNYWAELDDARTYAQKSRTTILDIVARTLTGKFARELAKEFVVEAFESVHNYVDNSGPVPILRKGSISAPYGQRVIIPINMRDGVIVGVSGVTEDVNMSLPHGAGRVLSRSEAHRTLDLEQFKEDMKHVVSPTVGALTLDESPRAYKSLETILEDIKPYLLKYRVFKPVFNYKGV